MLIGVLGAACTVAILLGAPVVARLPKARLSVAAVLLDAPNIFAVCAILLGAPKTAVLNPREDSVSHAGFVKRQVVLLHRGHGAIEGDGLSGS